jgi:hypothetical protein
VIFDKSSAQMSEFSTRLSSTIIPEVKLLPPSIRYRKFRISARRARQFISRKSPEAICDV